MKKVISILLVILMIFSVGCVSVSGASTGKLSVATVQGQAGGTVDVPIKIDTNPGIVGLMISVQYDPALTLTKVTNGTVLPEDGMTPGGDLTLNPYNVLWCKPTVTSNYTGTGTLVTLRFTIASNATDGTKEIRLSYDAGSTFNKDLAPVAFTTSNGGVTVKSPIPPHDEYKLNVSKTTVNVEKDKSETITYSTTPANQSVSLKVGTLTHCSVQMKGSNITITGTNVGTDTFKLVLTVNGEQKDAKTITVNVTDPPPAKEPKITTIKPSVTQIRKIDNIYLHAVVDNLPQGAKVVWSLNGSTLYLSQESAPCTIKDHPDNCYVCKVTGQGFKSGTTEVVCSVCDSNGTPLRDSKGNAISASIPIYVKSNLLYWIFDFFLTVLFGKTYDV